MALLKHDKAGDNNAKASQSAAIDLPGIEGHLLMAKHMQLVVENNSLS